MPGLSGVSNVFALPLPTAHLRLEKVEGASEGLHVWMPNEALEP